MIMGIQDEANKWHDKSEDVGKVFLDYFHDIFTTNPSNMDIIFQSMRCKVTVEMNGMLDKEFTKMEIKNALDQMNPNKAPSPDGMTACFYQKFWDILRNDINNVVYDYLNNGRDLSMINHTNVVLI